MNERNSFCGAEGRKKKLKKMELIYILNVMIIINDKFKVYTPTRRKVRGQVKEGNLLRSPAVRF